MRGQGIVAIADRRGAVARRWSRAAAADDSSARTTNGERQGAGAGRRRSRKLGPGRGQGQPDRVGGLRRGRLDRPEGRLGVGLREADGLPGQVKVGNTSDEMVTLMRTGQYDGVSASGDATLRLIAGGDVAPVNTDLVKNYADVFAALKNQPFNSVDGQMYGIPHGRGANLLMWRSDKIKQAPDSWGAVFDQASAEQGQGHGLRQPDLHRRRGAVPEGDEARAQDRQRSTSSTTSSSRPPSTCSRRSAQNIGEYWSDYTKEQAAFANGNSQIGTTWQVIANLLDGRQGADQDGAAEGGRHRVVGHLDDLLEGQAPELHVHVDGPHHLAEDERRRWRSGSGRRRRTQKACAETAVKDHCKIFHAEDEDYFSKVAYWTTPRKECGDDRGDGLQGLLRMGPGVDGDQGLRDLALHGRPRLQLGLLLSGPLGWLGIAYLGSLAVLFVAAFWHLDDVQRRGRQGLLVRELPDAVGRPTSTARSRAARSRSPPRSRSRIS